MSFLNKSCLFIWVLIFSFGCYRKQEYPYATGPYIGVPLGKTVVSSSGSYVLTFVSVENQEGRGYISITPWKPDGNWVWSPPVEYEASKTLIMWDELDRAWVYRKTLGLSVWSKNIIDQNWSEEGKRMDGGDVPALVIQQIERWALRRG